MFPTPSGEMFSPRLNWRSALIGVLMFLMGVGSVVFADRLHMEADTSESRQDRADLRRDVEHLKSDKSEPRRVHHAAGRDSQYGCKAGPYFDRQALGEL